MNQLSRQQLEKRADTTRSRLLSTVDELDRRRHDLTNLMVQVKRAAVPVAIGAGIVVVAFAGAIVWGISRARRKVVLPFTGGRTAKKAWTAPKQPAPPAWYMNFARSIMMSALSYVAGKLVERVGVSIPLLGQGRSMGVHPLAKRHNGSPNVVVRT